MVFEPFGDAQVHGFVHAKPCTRPIPVAGMVGADLPPRRHKDKKWYDHFKNIAACRGYAITAFMKTSVALRRLSKFA